MKKTRKKSKQASVAAKVCAADRKLFHTEVERKSVMLNLPNAEDRFIPISLRIQRKVLTRLDAIASIKGRSRSNLIGLVLQDFVSAKSQEAEAMEIRRQKDKRQAEIEHSESEIKRLAVSGKDLAGEIERLESERKFEASLK